MSIKVSDARKVPTTNQQVLIGALLVVPFFFFFLLRLIPSWDPLWQSSIFHFYIVSFTSLVAFVVALFVLAGIGSRGVQAIFVALAFAAISGLFFLHGAATPGLLLSGPGSHGIGLSARLSLLSGSLFLFLAIVDLSPLWQERIILHRRVLWLALGILYISYVGFVVVAPDAVAAIERTTVLNTILALTTIGILLWGAWRAWRQYLKEPRRLLLALALSFPWLALAQLSQYLAPAWRMSWWTYHVMMLSSFIVTIGVLITDYEEIRQFRATRYFTALSVIVGIPMVALLSEAAVRLSESESIRWPMFGFSLLAGSFVFVILLLIVRRAQTILNQRAEALEREKQWRVDFTNLIVHDLKSPLSVTWVSLSMVASGKLDAVSDKLRPSLERAQRGTKETLDMVENLLDVEKLEAGALRLVPTACSIPDLLNQSIESVRALADAHHITMDTILPNTLPPLQADEGLLKRVLQNLLSNAIKFTPDQGHIHLEATVNSQGVTVSVCDSGPGVPPDQRERIFEKFVQAENNERRGVGLGLALCKLAVEAHGGRIWVDDGPDNGSRFVFTLPLYAVKGAAVGRLPLS